VTTVSTLAAALESALDLFLKQDASRLEHCSVLTGKCIAIALTGTGITLYFLPDRDGVQVLSEYEGDVDTLLTGTPLGFARLGIDSREDALFQGAVQIEGDTATGQQFQDIFAGSSWDWEEQLSRFTGDIIAHQTGNLVRHAQRFIRNTGKSFADNTSEYLQEEARLLPTRCEISYFLEDVDKLRTDTDRLEARVERLLNSSVHGKS
jgi:ubiquinone biosynthesis protein UbiJ